MRVIVFDCETAHARVTMPDNKVKRVPIILEAGAIVSNLRGLIQPSFLPYDVMIKEVIERRDELDFTYTPHKQEFLANMDSPLNGIRPVSWENFTKCLQYFFGQDEVVFAAYNLNFDKSAIENTCRFVTGEEFQWPANVRFLDLWTAATDTFMQSRDYAETCDRQEWYTETGYYKTSAEAAYRYLTGNHDFNEAHTALDDCLTENVILAAIFSRKEWRDKLTWETRAFPWRNAQKYNTEHASRAESGGRKKPLRNLLNKLL